jgi:enoyl-CoA hydratase
LQVKCSGTSELLLALDRIREEKIMELKTIIYEKEGPIACITFNRPQVLNALNYELLDELGQVIDAISQDDEIRCVIVSGGPKCFAAGADISMLTELASSEGELFVEKAHLPMDKLANLNKP